MISKTFNDLDKRETLTKFFNVLNAIQKIKENKLVDSEIEILIEFMLLEEKYVYDRFSGRARKTVLERINANRKSPITSNLINVRIGGLKKKGLIREDSDKCKYINAKILDLLKEKTIEFNIKFNTND